MTLPIKVNFESPSNLLWWQILLTSQQNPGQSLYKIMIIAELILLIMNDDDGKRQGQSIVTATMSFMEHSRAIQDDGMSFLHRHKCMIYLPCLLSKPCGWKSSRTFISSRLHGMKWKFSPWARTVSPLIWYWWQLIGHKGYSKTVAQQTYKSIPLTTVCKKIQALYPLPKRVVSTDYSEQKINRQRS